MTMPSNTLGSSTPTVSTLLLCAAVHRLTKKQDSIYFTAGFDDFVAQYGGEEYVSRHELPRANILLIPRAVPHIPVGLVALKRGGCGDNVDRTQDIDDLAMDIGG